MFLFDPKGVLERREKGAHGQKFAMHGGEEGMSYLVWSSAISYMHRLGTRCFFRPSAKKELEWEIGSTGHNDCVTSARQQMRRLKKEIDPDDFRTQEQIRPSLNRNDRLLAIHEMLQDFENNDFHPNLDDRYAERMYKQASVARMKQDKWNAEEHDSDYDDPTLTERKRPNGRRRR